MINDTSSGTKMCACAEVSRSSSSSGCESNEFVKLIMIVDYGGHQC